MKFFLSSKIHGIRATDRNVDYIGSVTIDSDIMQQAGIDPFEKVSVVNLRNGNRWETYAIEGEPGSGVFELNGGSAHLGEVGDKCLVMTYEMTDEPSPKVIFIGQGNSIDKVCDYRETVRIFQRKVL